MLSIFKKTMTKEEFKAAREELGYTPDQMAAELGGYSQRAIYQWESGERKIPPAVEKLITIMLLAKG